MFIHHFNRKLFGTKRRKPKTWMLLLTQRAAAVRQHLIKTWHALDTLCMNHKTFYEYADSKDTLEKTQMSKLNHHRPIGSMLLFSGFFFRFIFNILAWFLEHFICILLLLFVLFLECFFYLFLKCNVKYSTVEKVGAANVHAGAPVRKAVRHTGGTREKLSSRDL